MFVNFLQIQRDKDSSKTVSIKELHQLICKASITNDAPLWSGLDGDVLLNNVCLYLICVEKDIDIDAICTSCGYKVYCKNSAVDVSKDFYNSSHIAEISYDYHNSHNLTPIRETMYSNIKIFERTYGEK